jgi:catechol 2,3-dioxygenase-like lactoylglutathione lyase family enzyme
MTVDYGKPPKGGFAKLVPELVVADIDESIKFWREALNFEIAYHRPENGFVYLQRREGAQIMLCQRAGQWEIAQLDMPYGRGAMFQIYVDSIQPVLDRLESLKAPLYAGPREIWRRWGDREGDKREFFVLDPNGYLIMLAEDLGERPLSEE